MKRLLITGAGGFIGSRCLAFAVACGFDVHAITSSSSRVGDASATWHRHDLLGDEDIAPLLDRIGPTHLLHLAWVTTPGEYWTSPLNERWALATRRLAERFVACGGQRIVAAGTCAEYDWSDGRCVEGRTPLSDATPYARAKHLAREHVESLAVSSAWARIFYAYGPGEPRQRLIASTILHLLRGEEAACGEGAQQRDFIHVDDIAGALVAVAGSDVRGPINVGLGEATAVAEIVRLIGRLTGRAHLLRIGARPADKPEPPLVVADVTRLRREVGFAPRLDLESGLNQTIRACMAELR